MAGRRAPADKAADAVDEQLARYRSMRHFEVTEEPSGGSTAAKQGWNAEGLPFCIQKHAASHLHYDFRLGWNGVLKSWACAKGPSYVVNDKRLAVQVEDHPMEYGGFEGIIPAGQYGGGTVMVWDQGTWEPQPGHTDVDAGLREGSIKVIMHGQKMRGKWALVRMGGKAASERKPNWLLIKEHDEFEQPSAEAGGPPAVTDAEPNSVVTGRSLEQIAKSEDHVWNSKETAGTGQAWFRQEARSSTVEQESGASAAKVVGKAPTTDIEPQSFAGAVKNLPSEVQPAFIKPQLALQAETPPEGAGWLHELKLDGYRMQARKAGSTVQMLTRSGLDWTGRMREVAAAVALLPADTVTLDGEAVVLAADGTTNFADLQASFQDGANNPLTYFCFDLLHLNGRDTRGMPLKLRKNLLGKVLAGADTAILTVSEHLETNGAAMFRQACALHAEGIISKRADAKYLPGGRAGEWLKLKCLHEQEFVIGGFTLPGKGHAGSVSIGALLLGYYKDGALVYAGRTGTGFTQKTHRMLREKLNHITQKTSSFGPMPAEAKRGAIWVKPELVAQVRFATWTAENLVRQAAFLGLREDKPATEVVREDAAPTPKRNVKSSPHPPPQVAPQVPPKQAGATASNPAPAQHAPVRLTHPQKILDLESGMTKQMLADFYWGVAERMLPQIAGRPLSLVRCPEGSGKPCFYQKHVNAMLPKGIGAIDVPDKKTGKLEPYITLDTRESLAGLAQMGVLEVHPWGSRNSDLEKPDRIVIDLDPDEALPWPILAGAAEEVKSRLKKLGLTSFLKTTGGKGLHIVVPVEATLDWTTLKEFTHRFVLEMEKARPALYLTKMTKAARVNKIYLDYLRNERGSTAVAAYSPRARAGAPVSMPLDWSELKAQAMPSFRVADFADWSARLKKDPWKKMAVTKQAVTPAILAAVGIRHENRT